MGAVSEEEASAGSTRMSVVATQKYLKSVVRAEGTQDPYCLLSLLSNIPQFLRLTLTPILKSPA